MTVSFSQLIYVLHKLRHDTWRIWVEFAHVVLMLAQMLKFYCQISTVRNFVCWAPWSVGQRLYMRYVTVRKWYCLTTNTNYHKHLLRRIHNKQQIGDLGWHCWIISIILMTYIRIALIIIGLSIYTQAMISTKSGLIRNYNVWQGLVSCLNRSQVINSTASQSTRF